MRGHGLLAAVLAGVMLAACNVALGLGGYEFSAGGAGGTGSHGGHDAGAGAEDGVDTCGEGVWSVSLSRYSVTGIAAGPGKTVFVAGRADDVGSLRCPSESGSGGGAGGSGNDGESGAGGSASFLIQLDNTGACVWGFFFDEIAPSTGVAVDATGNVALTGEFSGTLTIGPMGTSMMSDGVGVPMTPYNGGADSFVALFGPGSSHPLKWVAHIGGSGGSPAPPIGNRLTSAVAMNGGMLAVAGSYSGSLGVDAPAHMPPVPTPLATTAFGAFTVWFDANGYLAGSVNSKGDVDGVALDSNNNGAMVGTTTLSLPTQIFAKSYTETETLKFQTILGGTAGQGYPSAAFDAKNDLLLGGTFQHAIGVSGPSDAGTWYTAPTGVQNVFVARYDGTNGTLLSSLTFGSSTNNGEFAQLVGVAPYTDAHGVSSVVFAGTFSGAAGFTSFRSTPMLPDTKGIYVAKVSDDLRNGICLKGVDTTASPTAVAVDPSDGSILLTGYYQGTLDFGGKSKPLVSTSGESFVAKLTP